MCGVVWCVCVCVYGSLTIYPSPSQELAGHTPTRLADIREKGMCVGGEGAVAKFYSADASLLPATPETFWSFSLAESTP